MSPTLVMKIGNIYVPNVDSGHVLISCVARKHAFNSQIYAYLIATPTLFLGYFYRLAYALN